MTIGDVFAAISAALFLIFSWIALLLAAAYLLPARVEAARERIETSPVRCGLVGLATAIGGIVVTIILYRGAIGAGRLIPMAIGGAVIVAAAIGSAALVQIIARRSVRNAPWSEPGYEAMFRAAGVYVLAGLFPICGWMIVTPLALFVTLGATISTMMPRRSAKPALAASLSPSTDLAASSQAI